jgi:hypothetical protein
MRLFFPDESGKPLGTGRARSAALINQLATPGLGSLMAGRRFAGAGQLLLAVTGVGLVFVWFVQVLLIYYSLAQDDFPSTEPQIAYKLVESGALIFGAAWLWSLATSISLLREAKANAIQALEQTENKPPVIAGHGPQP